MTYRLDLRQRAVEFVKNGGSKAEASRVYKVSIWCIYDWCKRADLAPKKAPQRRKGKLDWEAVRQHVQKYPDAFFTQRKS